MKTIRYTTQFASMLAGLAVLTAAGLASAEDAGVVRLSDFTAPTTFEAIDSSEEIIRGQSDLRRRNAQTSQALRRMFFGEDAPQPIRYVPRTNPPAETASQFVPLTEASQQASGIPVQPTGLTGIAPAPPVAADACCPCDSTACCPVPCCDAVNDCCPTTCDGSSACCDANGCGNGCNDGCGNGYGLFGGRSGNNACPQCGGKGCPSCGGRGGSLLGGHGCGRNGCNSACGRGGRLGGCFNKCAANYRSRNLVASGHLNAYLRCKFGYFLHDGCGGVGAPLCGHYNLVYPVNPGYFDGRDGQVYAAAGYGGPVSVPLAPVVRQAYNYGWGIPSSRLTPVSTTSAP